MARLLGLRPVVWVDDVSATIAWYVNKLGFVQTAFEEEWQWGEIRKDGVWIMFAKPNEHTPYNAPVFTGSFYITTNDVDTLWAQWKDLPEIYYGLENFDYGMREFALKDYNGYILQFGQELTQEPE